MFTIRFNQCQTIYPLQIIRPIGKYKLDNQHFLDEFLTDCCINNCIIEAFIGDKPVRSNAKLCKSSSSYYPCEYCESKGLLCNTMDRELKAKKKKLHEELNRINNQIANAEDTNNIEQIEVLRTVQKTVTESIKAMNKKNNHIVWPASTRNGPTRTMEKVRDIVEQLDNNEIIGSDESKGIMGHSLLLDIPYFDFIIDATVEYLHGVCLGVVKRMIVLTFNVGEIRQRNTTRKLSSVSDFNKKMTKIKVVREYSRRARNLDFSVMKGQEFRNIIIVFFPIVIDCIPPSSKERRLWLLLAFMIRLCVLPEIEYQAVDNTEDILDYCGKQFYDLYEKLFHARNCSYYTHMIGSHMPQIRAKGPLTFTSAFPFESFYGELRHSFTPGTVNPLKQIMENIMLKRSISHHTCKSKIFFSPKESNLESNSLVYTFKENKYEFYKIQAIENNVFQCFKVGKYVHTLPETPTLHWDQIGVFQAGGISDDIVHVRKHDIAGKVLAVNELFLTCPNNVLLEK